MSGGRRAPGGPPTPPPDPPGAAAPGPAVGAPEFRALLSRWATGVAVVTARSEGRDSGLTVNSFTSASLDPPLVLILLTPDAETTPVLARSGRFAVSILAAEQRAVSERFAKMLAPEAKFDGIEVDRTPTGLAVVRGALGALECRVERTLAVGDHTLVVGRVERLLPGTGGAPLLFFRSRYAEAEGPGRLRLAGPDR